MRHRGIVIGLIVLLTLAGCASDTTSKKPPSKGELRSKIAREAVQQERTARKRKGEAAAKAWYQAAKLWIHPDNPKKSYGRSLTCFYRVNRKQADSETAEDTRIWISVLTQLLSAKEAATSLQDAAEGSEKLRKEMEP